MEQGQQGAATARYSLTLGEWFVAAAKKRPRQDLPMGLIVLRPTVRKKRKGVYKRRLLEVARLTLPAIRPNLTYPAASTPPLTSWATPIWRFASMA